jgi:hypothetical protein
LPFYELLALLRTSCPFTNFLPFYKLLALLRTSNLLRTSCPFTNFLPFYELLALLRTSNLLRTSCPFTNFLPFYELLRLACWLWSPLACAPGVSGQFSFSGNISRFAELRGSPQQLTLCRNSRLGLRYDQRKMELPDSRKFVSYRRKTAAWIKKMRNIGYGGKDTALRASQWEVMGPGRGASK